MSKLFSKMLMEHASLKDKREKRDVLKEKKYLAEQKKTLDKS